MKNINNVTEFILLGLTLNPELQKVICVVFLLIYLATLKGSLLIIITIATTLTLSSSMNYFLYYLSFMDCCCSSSLGPKMIIESLFEKKWVYDSALFAEYFFGGAEIILLIVMAYDHYVAICKPLYYTVIMSERLCSLLVGVAGVGGFLHAMIQLLIIVWLPFCGPNTIDHFMYDLFPLLSLVCMDTHVLGLFVAANSGLICLLNFIFLMASYVVILTSITSHSLEGSLKALSTCVSHVTVVLLFFIPCIFVYLSSMKIFPIDKAMTVFYSMITPMLNPLIYTLRNTKIKIVMRKL